MDWRMGREVVLDLCRVWTPIPQVTEQLLHAAQLQSLWARNYMFFLLWNSFFYTYYLLCKLWQRRTVDCEVKGFEGKDGWVWSEDWLAGDVKRLLTTRGFVPGELRRLFSGMGALEKVVFPERRRQAGLLLDEAGAVQPTCKLLAAQSEQTVKHRDLAKGTYRICVTFRFQSFMNFRVMRSRVKNFLLGPPALYKEEQKMSGSLCWHNGRWTAC